MNFEARATAIIRKAVWPDNPNSTAMAAAVLGLAQAMDRAGCSDRWHRQILRGLLDHFVHCGPNPANELDGIIRRYTVKRATWTTEWLNGKERCGDSD